MINVSYSDSHEDSQEPQYARYGDAGADLCCVEDFSLESGEYRMVSTGISIAIPDDCVGLIHPRSGLAAMHGITVLNAPGTIDSGYRGEIKVILINHGKSRYDFVSGQKIAQIVFQKFERANFIIEHVLNETERGSNGFGSTGKSRL
jgi:dUTP pyrophosphatase